MADPEKNELKRRWLPTTLVVVLLLAAAFYWAFDPEETSWAPRCMFHVLTGYDCPGCGSQRALHALLHGNVAAAWKFNALVVAGLPVLLLMSYAALMRRRMPRLYAAVNSVPVIVCCAVAVTAWFVARNILSI